MIRRYILISLAAIFACDAQQPPPIAFGGVPLGTMAFRNTAIERDPSPNYDYFEVRFLTFNGNASETFQLVSDATLDITDKPGVYRFRFLPRDTSYRKASALFERHGLIASRPAFLDTISVDLSGFGQPVLIDSMEIIVPPSTFILFPLNREVADTQIDQILRETFGSYSFTEWRLFSYVPEIERYVEYSGPAGNRKHPSEYFRGFSRGKAYFLISRQERRYTIPGGQLVSLDDGIITLKPGWNLIGSPYPFAVNWWDIIKRNKLESFVTRGRAFINRRLDPYDTSAALLPNQGYFVHSRLAQDIDIPVPSPILMNKAYAESKVDAGWRIGIGMKLGDDFRWCRMGFHSKDEIGAEQQSIPMPPLPFETSTISINREDNSRLTNLLEDIQLYNQEGYTWDLQVTRNTDQRDCVLQLYENKHMPTGYTIILLDMESTEIIPFSNTLVHSITYRETEYVRSFKLIAGIEEYATRMADKYCRNESEYHLSQNYPNPVFDTYTTVDITVPTEEYIILEVCNPLGRRMRTFQCGRLQPGRHCIRIDVSDLPAGMYTYSVITGSRRYEYKRFLVVK